MILPTEEMAKLNRKIAEAILFISRNLRRRRYLG